MLNNVDWIIVALALSLGVLGWVQGFVIGLASLVGLALGAVVGTRVAQGVLSEGETSAAAPALGLALGLGIAIVGSLLLQNVGAGMRRHVRGRGAVALDHMLGAALAAGVGLLLVWVAASAVIAAPRLRPLRPPLLQSSIVRSLNEALPPTRPLLNVLASYDPFPTFDGPRITTRAPDGNLPRDPEVRAAARSVVRVVGEACGWEVTGSGWVVAPGLVATNAHVVAGTAGSAAVQRGGYGERLDARLVAFDEVADVALLVVDDLGLKPLSQSASPRAAEPGAILGYPEGGPFDARAARYSDTRTVRSDDIYGRGPVERSITSFRGLVRHGNSGGPVVDGAGRVISTVFASTVGDAVQGGYGVPNDVLARVADEASGAEVDAGQCI